MKVNNGLITNLSGEIKTTIENRVEETLKLLNQIQDKTTLNYLKALLGLKYDYEQLSDFENAEKVARECLDILFSQGYRGVSQENTSKYVLDCYDTLARCGDFEAFLIAIEWNRPIEKQFYLPRRKILKKFGLIQAFQDVADGKLDFLCINMPPRSLG